MINANQIREDLKNIKYYYTHKAVFEEASQQLGESEVMKKVRIYNDIILSAPPKFYDLYYSLYMSGHTQESLSAKLCYTREYIRLLNKEFIEYLLEKLNEKEEISNAN